MKRIGNYIRTLTDERMIVDFAIPGVNPEAVSVTVRPNKFVDEDFPARNFGHDIVVKVDDEKLATPDGFGIYGDVYGFKDTVVVPGDFDIGAVTYAITNGVLRISVPKIEEWKGTAIGPDGKPVVAPAPAGN